MTFKRRLLLMHRMLLARYAPVGFRFEAGGLPRATVIQTPRGLQARNIEAA